MSNLVILLIVIPFFASFFVLLDRYLLNYYIADLISIIAVSLCLFFLVLLYPSMINGKIISYLVGGWKEPVGIALYMNGFAWVTSFIGVVICLLILIYARDNRNYTYDFYFLFLILIGGMQGVILTQDLFNMFVFFEILSIASYILIAHSKKSKSVIAGFNYLLISSLGMGFFLLGIVLFYGQTGVLSLREGAHLIDELGRGSRIFAFSLLLICVGIGIKAAFVPLHTWLPGAHAFAPHPVSAVLSAVMIKISFLAIWRILRIFQATHLQYILLWIGGITALVGIIWAIAQSDAKKLLAYSSISQMGFIIASFGVATSVSLTASFYHILSHSLFKSLLFLSIGVVIYTTGKRNIYELSGLGRKMPFVGMSFFIGAFSICGIPPFNGYVSKTLISISMKNFPFVYLLLFLASVGTVSSFSKLSGIFTGREINKDSNSQSKKLSRKISGGILTSLTVLSVLCLITGIFYQSGIRLVSRLILGEKIRYPVFIYSSSHLGGSGFVVFLGLVVYFFISTSRGKKVLRYIEKIKLGLNDSLLLVVVGFLIFVALSWIMGFKS